MKNGYIELIKTKHGFYWWIDYRYEDNKDGICEASIDYETDREAMRALITNTIEWGPYEDD